jgi:two-component system, cell cycle sensor histidine kinase and response regulator CckA
METRTEEPARPAQSATVLIVEDEDALRQAVAKMLGKAGFEVLEASDGSAAIDLLRAKGRKVDVVLLDLTLPGASSHEVVVEAAKARPDLKVVLTSAYSEEMATATWSTPLIHSFIRKPYQFGDLARTLRDALPS